MSKEINGCYSDYDRLWLEAVAGKRKVDPYEWDNLLSNAMANRILDYIDELEATIDRVKALPDEWRSQEWLSIPHEESKRLCASELESALSGKEVSDG